METELICPICTMPDIMSGVDGRLECATCGHEWQAEGDGPFAQLMDLVMQGDFVTLHLAVQSGVDPGPIAVLDDLKHWLRSP